MSPPIGDKKKRGRVEKRSEIREIALGANLYLYPLQNRNLERIEAITSDTSPSGISIYTQKKLKVGSEYTIDSKSNIQTFSKGKVVWCTRVEKSIYKVGLSLAAEKKKA